jgi:TetR/AcrR family transcriptional regulator, transcriptional repressor for nem operon
MSNAASSSSQKISARDKILDAALTAIRTKGFTATTVDDLCAAAGVTKGAFFHHFDSKDALGVAAAQHWSKVTSGFFADAPYHHHNDPLERVLAYIAFRRDILQGELPSSPASSAPWRRKSTRPPAQSLRPATPR